MMKRTLMRNPLLYLLMAMTSLFGGTACVDWFVPDYVINLECGICQLAESFRYQTYYKPSWTADGQRVMFDYDGPSNIYIVDSDGIELTPWIPQGAPSGDDLLEYDYSHDLNGSKVAFSTVRYAGINNSNKYEIATANLDGSDYRRLTDEDGSDLAPSWSPDGSKIAFISDRAVYDSREDTLRGLGYNLYVMDADGSNVQSLAPGISLPYTGRSTPYQPKWSSDGAWVAFRGPALLYTVDTKRFVTARFGLTNADPAWSPDGEWLAFVHVGPNFEEPGAIYIARPNRSEARKVFQFGPQDGYIRNALNLSWSPDGLSLRFTYAPANRGYSLSEIGVDGSGLQWVSYVPRGPKVVWSPDGSRAAISSIDPPGDQQYDPGDILLYTMAADGSDKRALVRQGVNGLEAANGG